MGLDWLMLPSPLLLVATLVLADTSPTPLVLSMLPRGRPRLRPMLMLSMVLTDTVFPTLPMVPTTTAMLDTPTPMVLTVMPATPTPTPLPTPSLWPLLPPPRSAPLLP